MLVNGQFHINPRKARYSEVIDRKRSTEEGLRIGRMRREIESHQERCELNKYHAEGDSYWEHLLDE
ncbi:MAG: hypothetical protein VX100_07285 [Pseudomonadota bacterium]|nr:hypothetical protein [Pseudomonadota bacterium]